MYRRRAGSRAGEGSITGGQTGRRGAGNREADRPAGTRRQACGQTGEGSVTGRICVGETFLESRESSVRSRDDLAETEWRERIYIEGAQGNVDGLIRGDQGRTMARARVCVCTNQDSSYLV